MISHNETTLSAHVEPRAERKFSQLSVIVPVYNEIFSIREILHRICAVAIPKEILVVDDGSDDGTADFLRSLSRGQWRDPAIDFSPTSIKVFFHSKNQGKGAAIRTALPEVTGEIVVIQDADLEYNPQEYHKLVAPILAGDADVVYGSRFRGETVRVNYFWHSVGNRALTLLSNIFTDLNLTDVETCYKAFKAEIIKSIPIRSNRFGFEPEITAKVAKLRCQIYEVPISYRGRSYEEGKKITWKDGLKAIFTIVRFWLIEDLYDQTNAGLRTLRIMEGAGSYNRWLFEQCRPLLGNRVLEVGAGVGNITKYLLGKPAVIATDVSESYVRELRIKFSHVPNVQVELLDLVKDSSVDHVFNVAGRVDTILSMNVLEHIKDDVAAVQNMFKLLAPGGRLMLLVPAHPWCFTAIDENLGHFRRYNRSGLSRLIKEAGFKVRKARYLNWLGALGWWVNGKLLRRKLIPSRQLRGFDKLIWLLYLEKFVPPPFGLSLLIIAEK